MGIPKFYYTITTQWPQIQSTISTGGQCDALYIDMPSLLHGCLKAASSIIEFHQLIGRFVAKLVALANPKTLVYLAFDGVPPLAKLKEQAERRRKSTFNQYLNPNILTPGTLDTRQLSEYIEQFAQEELISSGKTFEVIISNSNCPGEGEQKILKHIRGSDWAKVYIYGLDADLIVMALPLIDHKITIMRESYNTRGKELRNKVFNALNINLLRKLLLSEYQSDLSAQEDGLLRDIAFLFSIFGNDFLPKPHGLEVDLHSLNKYLKILYDYHHQQKRKESLFVVSKDGTIISENFKDFQDGITKAEFAEFKVSIPIKKAYLNEKILELELVGLSLTEKKQRTRNRVDDIERERFAKWKKESYETHTVGYMNMLFEDYYNGLNWVSRYYFNGDSCSWCYEYPFAPRLSDVKIGKRQETPPKVSEQRITPFEQLCLVLPQRSRHLLPQCYQEDQNLCRWLSENAEESIAGKLSALQKFTVPLLEKLTTQESERNQLQRPVTLNRSS